MNLTKTNSISTSLCQLLNAAGINDSAHTNLADIPAPPSGRRAEVVAFLSALEEAAQAAYRNNASYQQFFYTRAVQLARHKRVSLLGLTLADLLEIDSIAREDLKAALSGESEFTWNDLIEFARWWEELSQ